MRRYRGIVFCAVFLFLLTCAPVPASAAARYYVRASFKDRGTQKLVTRNLIRARRAADRNAQYYVYDSKGNVVYPRYRSVKKKVKRAVAWLKAITKDDRHGFYCDPKLESVSGYSTVKRYAPYTKKTYKKMKGYGERDGKKCGDYNCSTAVIVAYREAGIADLPAHGGVCVGNFVKTARKHGFREVTSEVDTATGAGLKKGDVLASIGTGRRNHMAVYLGKGRLFWAGYDWDGIPGDGSGSELTTRPYTNWAWNHVLRPTG